MCASFLDGSEKFLGEKNHRRGRCLVPLYEHKVMEVRPGCRVGPSPAVPAACRSPTTGLGPEPFILHSDFTLRLMGAAAASPPSVSYAVTQPACVVPQGRRPSRCGCVQADAAGWGPCPWALGLVCAAGGQLAVFLPLTETDVPCETAFSGVPML